MIRCSYWKSILWWIHQAIWSAERN